MRHVRGIRIKERVIRGRKETEGGKTVRRTGEKTDNNKQTQQTKDL